MTTRTVKLKGSRRPAQLLSATRWDPGKKEALHMTTQTVKIVEDLKKPLTTVKKEKKTCPAVFHYTYNGILSKEEAL